MPRQARLDAPGVLHHVMARGIEQSTIFRDDHDREDFIRRISELALQKAWMIYAWSLMPNHFHLLIRTGKESLSRNMRSLMSGYAGYFNRRHGRQGHLFQNRYKSIVCEEEVYFTELVRYLHLNPVRAGLIKDISDLDGFKYTGHSAITGKIKRPWQETEEVLGRFDDNHKEAVRKYRKFIAAGVKQGHRAELEGGGLLRSYDGWRGVLQLRKGREKYRFDERVLGTTSFIEEIMKKAQLHEERKRKSKGLKLQTLMERITKDMGIDREALRSGGRNRIIARARAILAYIWLRHLGRSGYELSEKLGVSPQSLYNASNRIGESDGIETKDIERWCS